MKKMVYICHRNEAQPSSQLPVAKYRQFFEFLYESPEQNFDPYILYSIIFTTAAKKGVKTLRYDFLYFLYFLYQNIGTVLPFLYSESKLI